MQGLGLKFRGERPSRPRWPPWPRPGLCGSLMMDSAPQPLRVLVGAPSQFPAFPPTSRFLPFSPTFQAVSSILDSGPSTRQPNSTPLVLRAALLPNVPFCRMGSLPRGGQGAFPPPPPRGACWRSRGSHPPVPRFKAPAPVSSNENPCCCSAGGPPAAAERERAARCSPRPRGGSDDTRPPCSRGDSAPDSLLFGLCRCTPVSYPEGLGPTRCPILFPLGPCTCGRGCGSLQDKAVRPSAAMSVTTRPPASYPHTLLLLPLRVSILGTFAAHTSILQGFRRDEGGPFCGSPKIQQKETAILRLCSTPKDPAGEPVGGCAPQIC